MHAFFQYTVTGAVVAGVIGRAAGLKPGPGSDMGDTLLFVICVLTGALAGATVSAFVLL